MEDVDYDTLIKIINKSIKASYEARRNDGDKLISNVANLGAKAGDVAKLERTGEYYGIAVQFLENSRPLLTDHFVTRILKMLKREDYTTPLDILGLENLEQLQYILHEWFQFATTEYDNELYSKNLKQFPMFDTWIQSVAHDPLLTKIKVVEIGQNQKTGNSVVPIEWIDKVFRDGYDMHKAMNSLESRIGKPPVTFAIIYSMRIQKQDTILNEIKDDYRYLFYLDWDGKKFYTRLSDKIKKNYQYVKYGSTAIGFKLVDILQPKTQNEHTTQNQLREVGLLVSRLQKSIRRGRYGSHALIETIERLNDSPNYNLPEHGFLRVSASKQLVWRLFIAIMEDCRPYQPINEPSLLDLIVLTLITQKVQEYKFTPSVLDAIKLVAILAQYNDDPDDVGDWGSEEQANKTPIVKNSDYHNAIALALNHLIMMASDTRMLRQYYSKKGDFLFEPYVRPPNINKPSDMSNMDKIKVLDHKKEVYNDIILSSYDMHVKTNIILYYQACIPISLTTRQIANYIWDVSSSYNVRFHEERPQLDPILISIQKYFSAESIKKTSKTEIESEIKASTSQYSNKIQTLVADDRARRISFLLLFGKKYRSNNHDVVLAGSATMPAQIKIKNEWLLDDRIKILDDYPEQIVKTSDIDAPFGFQWTKDSFSTAIIKGKPILDQKHINFFDGSSAIKSVTPVVQNNVSKKMYNFIVVLLSGLDIDFDVILDLKAKSSKKHAWINQHNSDVIVNWTLRSSDASNISLELIKSAYTKIFNQLSNIIMIGPVTRQGHKMQNSINYVLEGKLWAVFTWLSFIYPKTLRSSGTLNFIINKETSGYVHMIKSFERLLFAPKKIQGSLPSVTTKLWDHQNDSVKKILSGFNKGSFGFGDASQVGSGKTLTSIKLGCELIRQDDKIYSGILVLLPGNKLLKTWRDELTNHTTGFDVIFQENNTDIGPIKRNTIVVTTMARNRDHPISHQWLLLIIDECLTVQNKNALWTESAWTQSIMSKHLVMMSATFFRARFDKLYYMLKMLKTGLPEKKEYLDAILLESIVSQVSGISRKWTSNINYFKLDKKTREEYQEIEKSGLSTESKFAKLTSLLTTSTSANNAVTRQLAKLLDNVGKKHRCLIYARAKAEAELWSKALKIPIYPKKGHHCIVTYHDGTYGLNDLIIYDTLVMRPPAPDKLPQIKGRLDRHGQKLNNLSIEYFVLKDTIEMGLILRMNIASQFIHKYIMPLAKFYDVSVYYKRYLENNTSQDSTDDTSQDQDSINDDDTSQDQDSINDDDTSQDQDSINDDDTSC